VLDQECEVEADERGPEVEFAQGIVIRPVIFGNQK
jgi:hypothetical protein